MHYIMISVIKGISPTILFSLNFNNVTQKGKATSKNRNLFNRLVS